VPADDPDYAARNRWSAPVEVADGIEARSLRVGGH
jgi:hypothetical protein